MVKSQENQPFQNRLDALPKLCHQSPKTDLAIELSAEVPMPPVEVFRMKTTDREIPTSERAKCHKMSAPFQYVNKAYDTSWWFQPI